MNDQPNLPVVGQDTPVTPMAMLAQALTSGSLTAAEIASFKDLAEWWDRNNSRKAFEEAFAAATAEMPTIFKNKAVSYGAGKASYKHADLAEIVRTVRPVLSKYGLSHRFRVVTKPDKVTVTCVIGHRTGYFEENTMSCAPDTSGGKNHVQALGSAETYLSRYTLMASLGLAASDDDDVKAVGAGEVIDAEQVETLRAKLEVTKAGVAGFLKWAKLERLEEALAKNYDHYTRQIEAADRK